MVKLNSTAKNAVVLFINFQLSVRFEFKTLYMQASALTISATETWLTVSLNQQRLLITKALQATSTGHHLFVNGILPVKIVDGDVHEKLMIILFLQLTDQNNYFCLFASISLQIYHHGHRIGYLDFSQPPCKVKRATPRLSGVEDVAPLPPPLMEKFSNTSTWQQH